MRLIGLLVMVILLSGILEYLFKIIGLNDYLNFLIRIFVSMFLAWNWDNIWKYFMIKK